MIKNKNIYIILMITLIIFIGVGCTTNQDNLDRTQTRLGRYNNDDDIIKRNENYNNMNSNRNLTNLNDNMIKENNSMTNYNNDMSNNSKIAKKMSDEIKKIQGVNNAYVLLNDNNAIVGIDIDSEIEGEKTNYIKQKIESIVKRIDNNIDNVNVTSNPDLLTRIKNMYEDIDSGNAVQGFVNEFKEIFRRITPE